MNSVLWQCTKKNQEIFVNEANGKKKSWEIHAICTLWDENWAKIDKGKVKERIIVEIFWDEMVSKVNWRDRILNYYYYFIFFWWLGWEKPWVEVIWLLLMCAIIVKQVWCATTSRKSAETVEWNEWNPLRKCTMKELNVLYYMHYYTTREECVCDEIQKWRGGNHREDYTTPIDTFNSFIIDSSNSIFFLIPRYNISAMWGILCINFILDAYSLLWVPYVLKISP